MSAEEKLKLIERIAKTNDSVLLKEIGKVLEISAEEKTYELSKQQLRSLQVAEDQIKYGEVLDEAAAKKETKEWFDR
ncbi:MAG: hypothetical protein ABJP45_04680 [Cyclobacteriaceae bacterium]